jgi:Tol biopolymer transport system component/transcriptional regulator with XRE-family HTH domain
MNRLVGFWNAGAAELLRKAMEEKGLRVEDLAERLEVTPRTIRNWLRTDAPPSRPSVPSLPQLCAMVGVTPDEFRAAAEAFGRRESEEVPVAAAVAPRPRLHRAILPALLAIAAAMAVYAWMNVRSHGAEGSVTASPPVTFEIPPAVPSVYDMAFSGDVSPDGTQVAFLARSLPTQKRMLFVYSVAERTVRPIPATEGPFTSFFWNTDSRSLFFISKVDLMKIGLDGGPPERIARVGEAVKGTVHENGVVVLGSRQGLLQVNADGRTEPLTRVRPGDVAHSLPCFLPDGDHVLFSITEKREGQPLTRSLAVVSLRTRAMRIVGAIATRAQYANGQLLYVRDGTLVARQFDPESLTLRGPERALAEPVWSDVTTGEAAFSVSAATLLVTPPLHVPPLHQVSADGRLRRTIADPEDIRFVAVGRVTDQLVLVARGDADDRPVFWLYPLDHRERARLLRDVVEPSSPHFSPDDRRLYFAEPGESWANIYETDLPGGTRGRLTLPSTDLVAPRDVSPDGRFLLFQRWRNRDGGLWSMTLGDPKSARPFVDTPSDEGESARFSPDGRRVAFVARRGPEFSIYVADFPSNGQLARRAVDGDGWRARWSRDGREIYFVRGSSVLATDPETRATRRLFTMKQEITIFEPARDGGFYVREIATPPNRTVATTWWPRLSANPLRLAPPR